MNPHRKTGDGVWAGKKEERSSSCVDAFFFDFDGVIVDTETVWMNCLYDFCESRALPVKREDLLPYLGDGDRQAISYIAHMGGIEERGILSAVQPQFWKGVESLEPRPGICRYLTYARKNGIKLAVVSNSGGDYLHRWLKRLLLDKCFDCIVSRESALLPKPAPDLYLKAAELLHLEPARVIAVEDSLRGLRAAAAAGMCAVAFPHPASGPEVKKLFPFCLDLAKVSPDELIMRVRTRPGQKEVL